VVEIRAVKGKIPEMARWLRDLDSPEFAVREYASEVLGEAGAEIEEALREHLSATPSLEVKRRIDQLLTAVESRRRLRPPPSSFPVLFQPLNAERKSVDSLIRATEDPQRRLDAVRALGLLGPAARKAESVLQQLRRDDEPAVRQAAQTALWQIEE
jgi:HEAT repeat protein